MNVLVIGDEHIHGYGLASGKKSYIDHFIQRISPPGRTASIEAYTHLTTSELPFKLTQLRLNRYDLIILQLDYTLLQPLKANSAGSCTIAQEESHLPDNLKQSTQQGVFNRFKTFTSALRSIFQSQQALATVSVLLNQLKMYRHNVLIVSPFPHQKPANSRVHKRSRALLMQQANKLLFSVFDTDSIIRPVEEYFLPHDNNHLNAVSHELLGCSLFDFYLSAPTIATIQAIKRN